MALRNVSVQQSEEKRIFKAPPTRGQMVSAFQNVSSNKAAQEEGNVDSHGDPPSIVSAIRAFRPSCDHLTCIYKNVRKRWRSLTGSLVHRGAVTVTSDLLLFKALLYIKSSLLNVMPSARMAPLIALLVLLRCPGSRSLYDTTWQRFSG